MNVCEKEKVCGDCINGVILLKRLRRNSSEKMS